MKKFAAYIRRKAALDDKRIFYVVSIFFGLSLCFVSLFNDDTTLMYPEDTSFAGCIREAFRMYSTWSSRILVNFTVFFFTSRRSIVYWALFMGLSLYVLLWSIAKLLPYRSREVNLFAAAMVMLYPFKNLTTAGWIATMTTYFAPTAFGFFSLLPIKKTLEGEKIRAWEYILYVVALVYSTNNEQVMVLVAVCYVVSVLYFLLKKRRAVFCFIQLLLCGCSFLLVMRCPGNWARKQEEVARWFPTWWMLNSTDRIDLGYTTTVHWLFFENNFFLIFIAVFLAYLIWRQYRNQVLRFAAVLPPLFMILFGPFKEITKKMFPAAVKLADAIPKDGLVNAENLGNVYAFDVYMISSCLLLILLVELLLCVKSWRSALMVFTVLLGGTASRMVMGFVPTIYASGLRTCEVMAFAIIFIACYLYSAGVKEKIIGERTKRGILFMSRILLVLAMVNFCFLTATIQVS